MTGLSRRASEWRSGGIGPFEVKGRFPLRCEDVPLEFVRAMEGAGVDWCERVRWRGAGISIRSERFLAMVMVPLVDILRGTWLRRC